MTRKRRRVIITSLKRLGLALSAPASDLLRYFELTKALIPIWFAVVFGSAIGSCAAQDAPPRASIIACGEYRAVPLHTQSVTTFFQYPVDGVQNQDGRLSGAAAGVDVRIRLYREMIQAAYGLRIRYDHLYYETSSSLGVNGSVNAWTADHLLTLRIQFKLKEGGFISIAGGGGYMNRGSALTYNAVEYLPDGSEVFYTASADFTYNSTVAALAYQMNRLECGFTGYHNARPNELEFPSPYWVLAIHIGYRLTQ